MHKFCFCSSTLIKLTCKGNNDIHMVSNHNVLPSENVVFLCKKIFSNKLDISILLRSMNDSCVFQVKYDVQKPEKLRFCEIKIKLIDNIAFNIYYFGYMLYMYSVHNFRKNNSNFSCMSYKVNYLSTSIAKMIFNISVS